MKPDKSKLKMISLALLISILSISLSYAYEYTPFQYYGSDAGYYFPSYSTQDCVNESRQDFIIEIPAGGCSPSVIRSDLLEEQNVPVFCRITGYKMNPLIEIPYIKNIQPVYQQGSAPNSIAGMTFHPYRAALRSSYSSLIGTPLDNELGYVVVVLKKQPFESKIPDYYNLNLTARIEYSLTESFGVGQNELLLPEISDEEFKTEYQSYSFWYGKGYARATNIQENSARISLYTSSDKSFATFDISKGGTPKKSYLPGMYCSAGLEVELQEIVSPQTKAIIMVDGNKVEAVRNMKIADKCTVLKIETSEYGSGGKVTISCPEKTYSLEAVPARALISSSSGEAQWKNVGENITSDYSLAFAGKITVQPLQGSNIIVNFAVIGKKVDSKKIRNVNDKIESLLKKESGKFKDEDDIKSKIMSEVNSVDSAAFEVIFGNTPSTVFKDVTLEIKEIDAISQSSYSENVEDYFKKAVSTYEEVARDYKEVRDSEGKGERIGEKALWEAATKAGKLNKGEERARLLRLFVDLYPDSKFADQAQTELGLLYSTKGGTAETFIETGGKIHYLKLLEIKSPSGEEASVRIILNGVEKSFEIGERIDEGNWMIEQIKQNSIVLKYLGIKEGLIGSTREIISDKEEILPIEDASKVTKLKVKEIILKKEAKISIKPFSNKGVTYANFSVHIGTEKRAIQLSPEKTQELIDTLDKTIKDWENARDKLGKLVENWKRACYLGSATLWVKNFFTNVATGSGALARKEAMREALIEGKDGTMYKGWIEWCSDKANWDSVEGADKSGPAKTINDCLYRQKGKISETIDLKKESISSTNKVMDEIVKASKENGQLNNDLFFQNFAEKLKDCTVQESLSQFSQLAPGGERTTTGTLEASRVNEILGRASELKSYSTKSEARDLLEACNEYRISCIEQSKASDNCDGVREKLYGKISVYDGYLNDQDRKEESKGIVDLASKVPVKVADVSDGKPLASQITSVKELNNPPSEIKDDLKKPVTFVRFNLASNPQENKAELKGTYLLVLSEIGGKYVPDSGKIYKVTKEGTSAKYEPASEGEILRISSSISEISSYKSCNNPLKTNEIRFWDSGQFKGLPAIVLLKKAADGSDGWYAAIKGYPNVLSATSSSASSQAYTEAGQPQGFYICNVGPDGKPNFAEAPTGDDECCQYFALAETYNPKNGQTIRGLSEQETESLVNKAVRCIKSAATEYSKAKEGKTISVGDCGEMTVGKAKELTPNVQCEDFMSPTDCRIMYNLCDPVLCPPSRCNLGGSYQVSDVVQTGVIGSLVLCFPNYREGILMPVCLTGVHAGLDGYVSIMKAVQSCLKESLATGKNVGICDQLKSVYLCEFFWRQLAPFVRTGVPEFVEKVVLGRRSGGEYLTFAETWENSIKSAQYFMDYYGVNAMQAFKIRSTTEVGTAICRSFIGVRYPDSADLLDELSKPESPVQVNSWFDEIPFSSATNPPTSQYKVYWHIFAGNDQAAYYSIYLKEPPYSSGSSSPEVWTVQTGYIAKGGYSDISKDFTAPAGYKELCVRINLKEYCGFKKVSTGFTTNYLTDVYVASQQSNASTSGISSEEDCTSGKSSLLSSSLLLAIQPSVGALEESVASQIWRRGIIRVCSQENPGVGVNEDRWNRVGFCDSNNKIGCWVDRNSVEGAIKDLNLQNAALNDSLSTSNALLVSENGYLDEQTSLTVLQNWEEKGGIVYEAHKKVAALTVNSDEKAIDAAVGDAERQLKNFVGNTVSINSKTKALMELAVLYNEVVDKIYPKESKVIVSAKEKPSAIAVAGECSGKNWENEIKEVVEKEFSSYKTVNGYDLVYLTEAIISRESSGNPNAVSSQNAIGLMQVTLSTAKGMDSTITVESLKDPKTNIKFGIKYLISNINVYSAKAKLDLCKIKIKEIDSSYNTDNLDAVKCAIGQYLGFGKSGDALGTTAQNYIEEVIATYNKCAGSAPQEITAKTPAAEEVKDIFLESIFFGFGNSNALEQNIVDDFNAKTKQGTLLKEGDVIVIKGYSSLEGNEEYNTGLSGKRADFVKSVIESNFAELIMEKKIVLDSKGLGESNIYGAEITSQEVKDFEMKLESSKRNLETMLNKNPNMEPINEKLMWNRRVDIAIYRAYSGTCAFTNLEWIKKFASPSEKVNLLVEGKGCDGKTVQIKIKYSTLFGLYRPEVTRVSGIIKGRSAVIEFTPIDPSTLYGELEGLSTGKLKVKK